MLKFLADKYYTILVITGLYFIFHITIKDKIVDWYVRPNTVKRIIDDANSYAKQTFINNIFLYTFFAVLIILFILSLTLLFSKEGATISKWVLIGVPLLIAFLFFGIMSIGGFS